MRSWHSGGKDSGSMHCLGNGLICAYGQGPHIMQVFGPPYSQPSMMTVRVTGSAAAAVSRREAGAAIWHHEVRDGGSVVARMSDFAVADRPVLARRIEAREPLRLHVAPTPGVTVVDNTERFGGAGGRLLIAAEGTPVYGQYPCPFRIFHQVLWRGAAEVATERNESDAGFALICRPGETWLFLVGGPAYAEAVTAAEAVLAADPQRLLDRTREDWARFSEPRGRVLSAIPEDVPRRAELLQAADDVAAIIRTQQACEGGVLAGHPYHMGYVRDQFGVARGLMAMGHHAEARRILEFYWGVFQRFGRFQNAQAMGIEGLFHVHENDDVEITGYVLLQAFDCAARTGDEGLIETMLPMLEWCWEAQKPHLIEGMLPFNGDETYVAGGILPRSALNDGSAEATLLFIEGGRLLLDHVEVRGLWPAERLEADRELLGRVAEAYRPNFWREGRLLTNNPRRAAAGAMPRFRNGVCEAGGPFGPTERTDNGRYVSPPLFTSADLPPAPGEELMLQSVSLTPIYFGARLIPAEELRPAVEDIVALWRRTGALPSRPDGARSVGYDYGMVLYALTTLGHAAADDLAALALDVIDDTGAWTEYYENHVPQGSRYRPWESAINIEALLHWAARRG